MQGWEQLGIQLIVCLVVLAAILRFFFGPKSPLLGGSVKQIPELEVKIRMASGEELLDLLRAIAPLYARAGKKWEAEEALRRALTLAKQQWGESDPAVIAILKDSARLMDSMNRQSEAGVFKKEIKKIKKNSRQ